MPASVKERYEAMLEKDPGNERAAGFLANFGQALSHPDADDLEKLQMRIHTIFNGQK